MSDTENAPDLYKIPEFPMDKLRTRLKKLNKRAAKLNVAPVELVIHDETFEPDEGWIKVQIKMLGHYATSESVDDIRRRAPRIKFFHVELKGEAPKLAGWKFIGTLDHYTLPGKVIVGTVPGEEIPSKYYDYPPVCDHCQKERRRKETFVVEHEQGEQKAVGRQCIRDFLGHDPKAVVSFLDSLRNLASDMGDDDYLFGGDNGPRTPDYFDLEVVLVRSVAAIETYGWVSRQIARDRDEQATADVVAYSLTPPLRDARAYEQWKATLVKMGLYDDDKMAHYKEDAKAAIEWVKEQEVKNEYMHNLKMIVESEVVGYKLIGYTASIISAYQRAMERLRVQKLTFKKSEYVGTLKERREFDVKLVSVRHLESFYGVVHLHSFVDNEGRALVWFANTDSGMRVGGQYRIKGTVKKHEEYNNWKQTTLNRVVMLEELEEQEE